MAKDDGRFWSGPIKSAAHAERLIRYSAGTFAVFAGLFALTLFQDHGLAKIFTVLVIGVPALGLLRTKASGWAIVLLGLSAFAVIVSVLTSIYEATGGPDRDAAIFILPLGLFWAVFGYVAWRGLIAARYLRAVALRVPAEQVAPS